MIKGRDSSSVGLSWKNTVMRRILSLSRKLTPRFLHCAYTVRTWRPTSVLSSAFMEAYSARKSFRLLPPSAFGSAFSVSSSTDSTSSPASKSVF